MKLTSEIHLELLILLEVRKVTSTPVVLNLYHGEVDFIKLTTRFQLDPPAFMIYGRLLSGKIYFLAAFHLAPTTGEPEIFTVINPLPLPRWIFLQTLTPEFDVTVTYVL